MMIGDDVHILKRPVGTWEREYEDLNGACRKTAAYREIVRVFIPRRTSKKSVGLASSSSKRKQDRG